MDYIGNLSEPRTNAEQSETGRDFRVSYESKIRRFLEARRGGVSAQGRHLYFIKVAKGRGPVKIGRANDPLVRLATLQVASPYSLKLLGVLEDCGCHEAEFHRFLAPDRLRGEWFAWSRPVETIVKIALAGEDWRAAITQRRLEPMADEWRLGSPLYETIPAIKER